jgi:acyl-CoA thioesterase-2
MSSPVLNLLSILDLEQFATNVYRGTSPPVGMRRVFGGQVVGQALVAAVRTVEGVLPHSLHAYFILGGDPSIPIVYEVDRIRDGKSFTTRRVVAKQRDQAIFSMAASFHNDEPGLSHQMAMPKVPHPDQLPSDAEIREEILPQIPEVIRRFYQRLRPIELRPVDFRRYAGKPQPDNRFHIWFRTTTPLPDDPAIHRCALAYASDMTILDTALLPLGRSIFDEDIMGASLDHSVWFHRPFRADQWLLYSQDSPNAHGSRGFGRGLIFAADGTLVASVAQEGLMRPRRANP